jgi:peptide-methionine (S)-S-oxide reductase
LAFVIPYKKRNMSTNKEIATLAAGCFWCVEAVFQQLKGVETVESGYTGGHVKNPSYKDVCSGETGHAEVIQISYDPTVITFNEILKVFFKVHDPTTLNRQGADVGTQYRSSIFYHNDTQKEIAEKTIAALNESGAYADKIVTLVEPLNDYYKAEDYHQNYFNDNGDKNPYCQMVVRPKVEKFEKAFAEMLK